jgi:hypothetical protein
VLRLASGALALLLLAAPRALRAQPAEPPARVEQLGRYVGRAADHSWGAGLLARELYRRLDRAQLEDADRLLTRGLSHLSAHELPAMQADYDLLLTKYPQFSERSRLAPGYAALGAERLAHDDLAGGLAAYRRALWLDANADQARRWRAQLEYAATELMLTHGVADLAGYDRALGLDPQLPAARRARDALTGEQSRRLHERKHAAAAGSLLLFSLLAGLLLLRARKPRPAPSAG